MSLRFASIFVFEETGAIPGSTSALPASSAVSYGKSDGEKTFDKGLLPQMREKVTFYGGGVCPEEKKLLSIPVEAEQNPLALKKRD